VNDMADEKGKLQEQIARMTKVLEAAKKLKKK